MTTHLSQKIRILSFLSIILVLYIHSGFHDLPNEILGMPFNQELQRAISGDIGQLAVPLFFCISGYLFFRNIGSLADVWHKMKKRCRTLLLPYIPAALFFPLFYLAVEQIPQASRFINSSSVTEHFATTPLPTLLYEIFVSHDGAWGSPMAFQLWFLRDLIIIVALSPILFLLHKHLNRWVLLALLVVVFIAGKSLGGGLILSVFWFMMGAVGYPVSLSNRLVPSKWLTFAALCAFIFLITLEHVNPQLPALLSLLTITAGIATLWGGYNLLIPKNFVFRPSHFIYAASGFTFFIYLYHEPTLNIVRKIIAQPFHHSSFGFALSYLVSPWVFALAGVWIGMLLKKYCPKVYARLTGGR